MLWANQRASSTARAEANGYRFTFFLVGNDVVTLTPEKAPGDRL
jgi:hypothetical protein